jgi:hypothetical protein
MFYLIQPNDMVELTCSELTSSGKLDFEKEKNPLLEPLDSERTDVIHLYIPLLGVLVSAFRNQGVARQNK